ncbi:hypothetical protein P3S68_021829 [Capsicum galapagoense]
MVLLSYISSTTIIFQACHHVTGTPLGISHLDCLFSCTTKLISSLHKSCCRFVLFWLLALVGSSIDPSSWEDKKNPDESHFLAQRMRI